VRRTLSAFALALIGSQAGAQISTRATFYLIVANDTVTAERVERDPGQLTFKLFDLKQRMRIDFSGRTNADGLIELASQRIYRAATDSHPAMSVVARFHGDSVGLTRSGNDSWLRIGAGALPSMNVSAALLEQALIRARVVGGDSVAIPLMFLPSGPSVPATVVRNGTDSAIVRIGPVSLRAAVSPEGMLLGAVIPSQNARYARGPLISGPLPGSKSFAAPPGAPYTAQDVTIRTPGGITLRGTLTLPLRASGDRVAAVVTISGSGPQDRDATPQGLPAYRPFYQLADTLGRRGVAVLRLDDRGAGSDAGPPTVTSADFADDVRAAVAWLRAHPAIHPQRIALVGHSEGGIIAPMVAATDSGIAAIVLMAGTASPGREILGFQQRYMTDSVARLVGQQREFALAMYARNMDTIAATMPWMRFFLDYDGSATARRVKAPTLILHGEKDYQVPVAEAEKLAAAVRGGGNRDVTVRVFPGTNHLFLPYAGHGFSYEKLPSFAVTPEVLGAIADWLVTRFAR
jgi:fermentation-respiration switch protein FrsA (DUF1100 family)